MMTQGEKSTAFPCPVPSGALPPLVKLQGTSRKPASTTLDLVEENQPARIGHDRPRQSAHSGNYVTGLAINRALGSGPLNSEQSNRSMAFSSLNASLIIFIGGLVFWHLGNNSYFTFLRIVARAERYTTRYDASKHDIPRV